MSENIKVFVRCRPPKDDEQLANLELGPGEENVRIPSQNKEFHFDNVFPDQTPQEDVFKTVVLPLTPQVLQGYNCAVLAYGQTGTGKTYTMEGEQPGRDSIGIIPRAVSHIFESLRQRDQRFSVAVSFLELYSEEAYDLLSSPEDTTKLRIFDDKNKLRSVKIEGLKEVPVNSESDIFELLARGSNKRQTAVTLLNACSSRSHSIFTITVNVKMNTLDDREITRIGKLNLVDLAGSENVARSGAQNKNAREAGNINQSLLTLTRVITALVEKRPHVPYRESKLTRILQDSLGGATRTSMIATISPAEADLNNTISTLDYASRARKIVNRAESNRQISRKTSDDLEMYKDDLESRIRTEVALEFRKETDKIKEQHREDLENSIAVYKKMLNDQQQANQELQKELTIANNTLKDKELGQQDLVEELTAARSALKDQDIAHQELQKELEMASHALKDREQEHQVLQKELDKASQELKILSHALKDKERENQKLQKELEKASHTLTDKDQALQKELTVVRNMLKDKEKAHQELQKELKIASYMLKDKEKLIEDLRRDFKKRECELMQKKQQEQEEEEQQEQQENPLKEDYANLTFTGDDEIVQVSTKKTRKRIRPEPKHLTLSGKKRKLKNYAADVEVSPISPPMRCTRSRRKLAY